MNDIFPVDTRFMETLTYLAAGDVNREIGAPLSTDQTRGNRCDLLTYFVMEAMQNQGLPVRREFHTNGKFWHYILAHDAPNAEPSEDDIISDLNPYQGRAQGGRILHGPRREVLHDLTQAGVDLVMVTLRSTATIEAPHDVRKYPAMNTTLNDLTI